jgi:hypothetical protein
LRRVLHFRSEKDGSCTSPERGPGSDKLLQLFEAGCAQQFEEGA